MAETSGRIVLQELLPEGVKTVFESGRVVLLDYLIDPETGEKYIDLDPNREIFQYEGKI